MSSLPLCPQLSPFYKLESALTVGFITAAMSVPWLWKEIEDFISISISLCCISASRCQNDLGWDFLQWLNSAPIKDCRNFTIDSSGSRVDPQRTLEIGQISQIKLNISFFSHSWITHLKMWVGNPDRAVLEGFYYVFIQPTGGFTTDICYRCMTSPGNAKEIATQIM